MAEMKEEGQKKLRDLIEDIKTCMFTTNDEQCNIFSRPMFTVKIDNECNLWFFTNESPAKMDISAGGQVTLVFSHPGKNSYMNVYGQCEIIDDKIKMKELWQPTLKAWFSNGIDCPDIRLLKVAIREAFYWDNSTNDMICVYKNESHIAYQTVVEDEIFIPQTSNW